MFATYTRNTAEDVPTVSKILVYIRMHYVCAPLFYVIVNFYFNFALGMLGTLPFVILGMLSIRADN